MKRWISFDADEIAPVSEKKVEKSTPKKQKSVPKPKQTKNVPKENLFKNEIKTSFNKFNFEKSVQPKKKEELAVHSKKIEEVESWLVNFVLNKSNRNQASLLVISGPTGCGKTTTIRILCKQLGIELSEWVNPIYDNDDYKGPGQITRLTDFIGESKYPSLLTNNNKGKVVLIEDFPNILISNPTEFESVLEKCHNCTSHNIIFVCTDSGSTSLNIAQSLFPDEVRQKYGIGKITFNACASTILKGAIKRIQAIMEKHTDIFRIPNQSTVDAIIASSAGDITSSINQYYVACLKGISDLPTIQETVEKQNSTVQKRKRSQTISKIKNMSKDETLGLFHGIGRVLNPKRKETPNGWRLNCDLEPLIDEFSTHPISILGFLQENYLKHFGEIEDVSVAANILSETQLLMKNVYGNNFDSTRVVLWSCVMGLMISNEHRVTGFNPIRGPTKINKIDFGMEDRHLDPSDRFYYNFINKSDKYHKFN